VSVERIRGAGPDYHMPVDSRLGVIWAATEDLSTLDVFIVFPGGLQHFSPGPPCAPGASDATSWCTGVLGLLMYRNLISEADFIPLLELARDFYSPRGLWHAGCERQ
jgi:hypothetical protein